MSFAIDANILIYSAQSDSPHHERASRFLRSCWEGSDAVYLPWPVVMAYLRLVTHPSLFKHPVSLERALADIEALLSLPHVRALGEDERFLESFRASSAGAGIRGPLVSDAHVAALLRMHGVRVLYTNDADFRRFTFLDVRNPLTG